MKLHALRRIGGRLALTDLKASSECHGLPFEKRAFECLICSGNTLSVALLDRVSDDRCMIQLFLLDHSLEPFYASGRFSVLACDGVVAVQHVQVIGPAARKLFP